MVIPLLLFAHVIELEVEQSSEDFVGPGNKLADKPTHLTSGKAMKNLSVSDLRLANRIFSPRKKPPIHCICRGFFDSRVLTLTVFPFICPFNLCFAALQETEIQDLQKMKRVCVDDKLPSGAELV